MAAQPTTNAVLVFESTEFDVVDLHNVPWLRGSQVASALGSENPRRYITELYDRNADEFTDEMTQVLDLPTAGGIQPVRIFSPRGCYLLGMLARTEKAKAFRAWVLDVLEGRVAPRESRPMTIPQTIAMHKLRVALMKDLGRHTDAGMRQALHHQLVHVSRLLALPAPALDSIGRTIAGLEGV